MRPQLPLAVKPVEVKVREGHEKDGLTPEQVVTLIDLICDQTQFAQASSRPATAAASCRC